ncbi:sodium:solute symporter family transporter [Kribbella qitaiheensis]|uniref:sodium:solute symporter family transporter n=1 Tax=Kribbella qitaiheensis TaxID=1544730 RepID=UPI001FECC1AF|nr:hypothetical protein [Kribbella qitaiheensis]
MLAYSGALLKVVDIAAKWVAIAVLLTGFTGVPMRWGILLTGVVTMLYATLGGLWADVLTDFGQFIIQAAAGIAMFAAPLLVPGLAKPEQSYVAMSQLLLPSGLIGLVLAGFFSHTMAMVASDANAISSVITRDLGPVLVPKLRQLTDAGILKFARIVTVSFVTVSMLIAIITNGQGVVLKIVVDLVAATMGPIAIPLMLGLLPWFRRSGSRAAIASWAIGLIVWTVVKWGLGSTDTTLVVALPLVTSLVVYVGLGWLLPERRPEVDELLDSLNSDPVDADEVDADEVTARRAAAVG